MNNRFGIKDLFLYVLILSIGLLIILKMVQADRQWAKSELLLGKVGSLETQIARGEAKLDAQAESTQRDSASIKGIAAQLAQIQSSLASGVVVSKSDSATTTPKPQAGAVVPSPDQANRDTTWARPDVIIDWQPAPKFNRDPQDAKGFARGGEFAEIFEAQPKVLTPFVAEDVYARRIQEVALESLGVLDPQSLVYRGQLAEAWQIDPLGVWFRVRIRANARFSDGQPVTAEDVRYTFHDYIMNEQIDAERTRSIMRDSILAVKAIDPRTVEFSFKERLFSNVTNALSMFVLPKHFYSKFSPAQINQSTGLLFGSGSFRMKDFSADRQWAHPAPIVLERNEQYWGSKPALAAIRYSAINEEVARLNAFANGEADMITPTAPQFFSKAADPVWAPRAQFLNWVNMRSGYSFIAWNCGERNGKLTPFHDVRVRRAMTMLIDREAMIRDIWKGVGVVAKGSQPLGSPGENNEIKPWPFDKPRALALLKEAGWADRDGRGILTDVNGNKFQFEYSFAGGSEIAERVARFVKDAMASVGIEVTLRSADWAVYQDFMKKRDFDAITLSWGASGPESDPNQIYHSQSIKNQGDNFVQWNSPDADKLIDEGRRELDPAKRAAIWRQLEAVIHEGQPYTFVRNPPWLRLVNPAVGNVSLYPSGLVPQEFFRGSGPYTPMPGL